MLSGEQEPSATSRSTSAAALVSLYLGFQLLGVVGLFLGPLVVIVFQAMKDAGLFDVKIKLDEEDCNITCIMNQRQIRT